MTSSSANNSQKKRIHFLIGLLVLVIAYNMAILLQWIPSDYAWGGRINSPQALFTAGIVSVIFNLVLIGLLIRKGKNDNRKVIHVFLWIYLIYFVLNTIGNLLAPTWIEKSFALITFLFVVLLLSILKKDKNNSLPTSSIE